MRKRPILFNALMVRALLNGNKTKTRRCLSNTAFDILTSGLSVKELNKYCPCPYGQVGDNLWVKETFYAWGFWEKKFNDKKNRPEWHFVDETLDTKRVYEYVVDQPHKPIGKRVVGAATWHKRPSIFMPRAASRIDLKITDFRIECLNDISEYDAIQEGYKGYGVDGKFIAAKTWYRELWESIHGAGSWDKNPLVWCITFRRIKP